MAHAVKRSTGGESRSTRDKRIPDIHERADQALVAAPLTKKAIAKEEDVSWQQLLHLNSTLPRVRGREEDGGLRLRNLFLFILFILFLRMRNLFLFTLFILFLRMRNLARLRTAMDQSYKQQNGELLFSWIEEIFETLLFVFLA